MHIRHDHGGMGDPVSEPCAVMLNSRFLAAVAADVLDVVAPRDCLACSKPGRTLCDRCTEELTSVPPALDGHRIQAPVAIGGWFDGSLGAVVRGYKSGAGRTLADPLAHILAGAIEHLLDAVDLGPISVHGGSAACRLVPIPVSLRARWERGDDVLGRIVDRAARLMRTRGRTVEVVRWLEPARLVRDQRALGARSRLLNVEGSLRVHRSMTIPRGFRCPVVVIDDVMTTGATMTEAMRALGASGLTVPVTGGAVIAATRPRCGRTSLVLDEGVG